MTDVAHDQKPRVLIAAGPWKAPNSLKNDADFRASIDAGNEVYTVMRGVYFAVTAVGDKGVLYSSLPTKPAGLPDFAVAE